MENPQQNSGLRESRGGALHLFRLILKSLSRKGFYHGSPRALSPFGSRPVASLPLARGLAPALASRSFSPNVASLRKMANNPNRFRYLQFGL